MGFLKFLFPVCFFNLFWLSGSIDFHYFTIQKQILKKKIMEVIGEVIIHDSFPITKVESIHLKVEFAHSDMRSDCNKKQEKEIVKTTHSASPSPSTSFAFSPPSFFSSRSIS